MNARIAQGFSLDFRHIYCEEMDLCAFNVDHYDSCTYVLPWNTHIIIIISNCCSNFTITLCPFTFVLQQFWDVSNYKLLVSLFVPFLVNF